MLGPALGPEIEQLLERRDFATLKAALRDFENADIAEMLQEFESEQRAITFRLLGRAKATEVFSVLPLECQEDLIEWLNDASIARIINDMSPDDRTELLEEVPGEVASKLMASLRGKEREIALALLNYPVDSIGRLMTPEYVAIRPDWTVQAVIEHIRKVAPQKETVNQLYVIDTRGVLLDHIKLQDVVLAPEDSTVEDLMAGPAEEPALLAREDKETAVELFKKYDLPSLPVVDGQGVMVGIVTSDDVLDLQEEEDTEDFQRMAAVGPLEEPYFQTGYWEMMGKRLPWLAFLLVAELFTAMAIHTHTESMTKELITAIVLFMPLVNASAGNIGSQMAGLVIRSLAVGEMDLADWARICGRELTMGLTLSIILGAMAWGAALLFDSPSYVGPILAVSMLSAMTVANLAGALIPLTLKRINLDPAVTSAPLIASLMDVLSAVVYFGSATIIFSQYAG